MTNHLKLTQKEIDLVLESRKQEVEKIEQKQRRINRFTKEGILKEDLIYVKNVFDKLYYNKNMLVCESKAELTRIFSKIFPKVLNETKISLEKGTRFYYDSHDDFETWKIGDWREDHYRGRIICFKNIDKYLENITTIKHS